MTTTIRVEFNGQSKTVVPSVKIESDELDGEEILQKADILYAKAEKIAINYAMARM